MEREAVRLRNTFQRSAVLDAVKARNDHPCADDIYFDVHQKYPKLSRGTVYRNLKLLSEMGEIMHICIPGSPDRYDLTTSPHYHFVCQRCASVSDVPLPYMSGIDHIDGYVVFGHALTFKGLCRKCAGGSN